MRFEAAVELSNRASGWLAPGEQSLLYRLAQQVPSSSAIVELGSWQGRSTIMLGAGSAAGGGATVYAVDFFRPMGATEELYARELESGEREEYLTLFRHNVAEAGLVARVEPRQGSTIEQARRWNGPPVGLLFIDADHSYRSVRDDFLAWAPHCATGAIVAFHDYAGEGPSEVARFVDRLVLSGVVSGSQVVDSILYGSLATASRRALRWRLMACPDLLPYAIRVRLASRKLGALRSCA